MRFRKPIFFWWVFFLLGSFGVATGEEVRESVIAGAWYPGDAAVLRRQVETYLKKTPLQADSGRLVALISPHAGYEYSGETAAYAYNLLKGRSFDTVVIVAPSHHAAFRGVSVYDRGGYRTPLGLVPLDIEFIDALKNADKSIRYVAKAHDREHAIEIQLPFIQSVLSGFKLVPLVMGSQDLASCRRLADALAVCAKNKSVLLVASSDLSHYHGRETARRMDGQAAARVSAFDPEGLHADLAEGECEACGGGPVVSVMLAARKLGADRSKVLHIGDSGDAGGDTSRVVGYMAAAFWVKGEEGMSEENEKGEPKALDVEAQRLLKEIAQGAISSALESRGYTLPETLPAVLKAPCGAFVTLTKQGELRGCIGYLSASAPLADTVREVAVAAAFEDSRFSPVTPAEWPGIDVEISVLTPMAPVSNISSIRPGVHGLYIRKGFRSGLLLPQVATDHGWDAKTFLEQTCRKAGLPRDAWKEKGAEIYCFTAQVF